MIIKSKTLIKSNSSGRKYKQLFANYKITFSTHFGVIFYTV